MRALLDCPVHAIIAIGEHGPSGDGAAHSRTTDGKPEPHIETEDSEAISGFVR